MSTIREAQFSAEQAFLKEEHAKNLLEAFRVRNQLRAELSEAIDVIEALVLQGAYLGSKPMQRADEFVKRMKEGGK